MSSSTSDTPDTDAPLEVNEQPEAESEIDKLPVAKEQTMSVLDYPHLQSYFDLKSPTTDEKNQLKEIWEYLAIESKDMGDLVYRLRTMENRLAMPPLGQSRLSYLNSYVKVLRDLRAISRERDSYQNRN